MLNLSFQWLILGLLDLVMVFVIATIAHKNRTYSQLKYLLQELEGELPTMREGNILNNTNEGRERVGFAVLYVR